mgnify:FL=1
MAGGGKNTFSSTQLYAEARDEGGKSYERTLLQCAEILLRDEGEPVNTVLNALLQVTGVSRVYLFVNEHNDNGELCMTQEAEVCAEGIEPQIMNPELQMLPYSRGYTRWKETLEGGDYILGDVDFFPEEEQSTLREQDIESILVIPIFTKFKWHGFIGFDETKEPRTWQLNEIRLIATAGKILGFYLSRKIMESSLKEAEAKNRESLLYISTILDNLPFRAWLKDRHGKYLAVNKPFLRFNGVGLDEIIGKTEAEIRSSMAAPAAFIDRISEIEKEDREPVEKNIDGPDGKRWYHYFIKPVFHGGDVYAGIAGVAIDVTEIKESEEALKEINDAKDRLFSTIAHDLRSPIVALSNLLRLISLEEEVLSEEEKKEYINSLHKSVNSTLLLLDNLFRWAQSQKQGISINKERFALKPIIEENCNLFEGRLQDKNIRADVSGVDDISLFADRNMVSTVIRNLFSNAVKFTHSGGEITVFAEENEREVTITVCDSGIGMSESDLERLLQDGSRLTKRGTDAETGTGLGLSICREYVEKNGGTLTIESREGEGTVVTIKFKDLQSE